MVKIMLLLLRERVRNNTECGKNDPAEQIPYASASFQIHCYKSVTLFFGGGTASDISYSPAKSAMCSLVQNISKEFSKHFSAAHILHSHTPSFRPADFL